MLDELLPWSRAHGSSVVVLLTVASVRSLRRVQALANLVDYLLIADQDKCKICTPWILIPTLLPPSIA
jgi:hypothetical protein